MNRSLILAIVVLFALSACGGGATNSLPSPGQAAARPAPPRSKHKINAKIRITIPKRKHHRRIRVHGHYISPATQSIAITITTTSGPATQANANLTVAANPECTVSLVSTLICTVSLDLSPGSYTGDFATYDGPLSGAGGPTDAPTGAVLSANQSFPFTIAAGSANSVNVALDGVPTAVALVPAANSTISGDETDGFTASKCGSPTATTERVSVLGVDADGNYILGPGAPKPLLESTDSATVAVATPAPNSQSPNLFTLTHPISGFSQGPVAIVIAAVPAADSGGANASILSSITIAGDTTTLCGVVTEYPLSVGAHPLGIAAGADGNMWFAEEGPSKIAKITGKGVVTGYSIPTTASAPRGVTEGADGNIWFTEYTKGKIGSITTGGAIAEYSTATASLGLSGIANGPSGTIWATDNMGNTVGFLSGGVFTSYTATTPQSNNPDPNGIAEASDGNMWFTNCQGYVDKITPAGVATSFSIPTGGVSRYIAVGADGNLWFTQAFDNAVGQVTTAGVFQDFPLANGVSGFGIAAGPNNSVWFTESNNKIGAMTTTGTLTEYPIPSGNSNAFGLAEGPDGSLWFTECATNKIGRVQ
jgi:streptogramin lyase